MNRLPGVEVVSIVHVIDDIDEESDVPITFEPQNDEAALARAYLFLRECRPGRSIYVWINPTLKPSLAIRSMNRYIRSGFRHFILTAHEREIQRAIEDWKVLKCEPEVTLLLPNVEGA